MQYGGSLGQAGLARSLVAEARLILRKATQSDLGPKIVAGRPVCPLIV